MFAPKVAKPQTKAVEHSASKQAREDSTLARHRYGRDPIQQDPFLRGAIGNQATPQLFGKQDSHPDQGIGLKNKAISNEGSGIFRDFSNIPLSSPERVRQFQPSFPAPTARFAGAIQAKLEVGAVDDPMEREADRVAEQVMRMPDAVAVAPPAVRGRVIPGMQRKCSCGGTCADCQKNHSKPETLQRAGATIEPLVPTTAPPAVHRVLESPGQPLDATTRAFMEPRFHHNFSHVRLHSDQAAADSARAIGARAYASGPHVVFGRGQFAAGSIQGVKLLAHELAHVVQQGHGKPVGSVPAATQTSAVVQRSPQNSGSPGGDLNDLVKQLEFDLMDARIGADKQKRQILATEGEGYWNRFGRAAATKRIYNVQERLSAVRLQQASPKNQRTLYDVKVVGLEFGDTIGGKALTTGDKVKSLKNKYGGFPRTFDALAYVEDTNGEVLGAQPVELKSEGAQTEKSLLANSVKGGINRGDIKANYRPSSTIAKQVKMTTDLSQAAADAEGWLVLRGRDAVTDQEVTIRVRPERLAGERITSYGRLPDIVTVPVPKQGPRGNGSGGAGGSKAKKAKDADADSKVKNAKPAKNADSDSKTPKTAPAKDADTGSKTDKTAPAKDADTGSSGTKGTPATKEPTAKPGAAKPGASSTTGTSPVPEITKPTPAPQPTTPAPVHPVEPPTPAGGAKPSTSGGASEPLLPKLNLSDFPPDREGPIARHFNDGASIGVLTSIFSGAQTVAALATDKDISLLGLVQWHFDTAVDMATIEFRSLYPDVGFLQRSAHLDQLFNDYSAAKTELNALQDKLRFQEVMAGLSTQNEELQNARVKQVQQDYARAQSVGGQGRWKNYTNAGAAYISKVERLQEQMEPADATSPINAMPPVVADLERRSSILTRAASELERSYYVMLQTGVALVPFVDIQLLELLHIAGILKHFGGRIGTLANEITSVVDAYERAWDQMAKNVEIIRRDAEKLSHRYGQKKPDF